MADLEGVIDLGDDQRGEDAEDHRRRVVAERFLRSDNARVLERVIRAVLLVGLVLFDQQSVIPGVARVGLDVNAVVLAVGVEIDPARHRRRLDAEADMEQMQQRSVVGIPRVLRVKLPVRLHDLAVVPEDADRAAGEALDMLHRNGTQIVFQRRRIAVEAAEHQSAERRRFQTSHAAPGNLEVVRHTALALYPLLLGHREQSAGMVVAPHVIGAVELARVAAQPGDHLRAAMGAAVLEGVNRAFLAPHDDHAALAEIGRRIIALVGDFPLQREILPVRAAEHPVELDVVEFAVVEYLERHPCAVVGRPPDIEPGAPGRGHLRSSRGEATAEW